MYCVCFCATCGDVSECDSHSEDMDDTEIVSEDVIGTDGTPPTIAATSSQSGSTGKPAPSRLIELDLNSPAGSDTNVYRIEIINSFSWLPLTDGRIGSIAFCVLGKRNTGISSRVAKVCFFVRQDSRIYAVEAGELTDGWKAFQKVAISAELLELLSTHLDPDDESHPVFDSATDAIEVGFGIKWQVLADDDDLSEEVFFDEFCANITTVPNECACFDSRDFSVTIPALTVGTQDSCPYFEGTHILQFARKALDWCFYEGPEIFYGRFTVGSVEYDHYAVVIMQATNTVSQSSLLRLVNRRRPVDAPESSTDTGAAVGYVKSGFINCGGDTVFNLNAPNACGGSPSTLTVSYYEP